MNLNLHPHWEKYPEPIQRQLVWLKTGQIYQPPSRVVMVALMLGLMLVFVLLGWRLNLLLPMIVLGLLFDAGVWWAYRVGRGATYRRRSCALAKEILEYPPMPSSGKAHLMLHPLRAYERNHDWYDAEGVLLPTQDVSCEVWGAESEQGWRLFINPRESHAYFKLHEWPEGSWAADLYYHPDVPWPVLVVTEADVLFPFAQPEPLMKAKVAI